MSDYISRQAAIDAIKRAIWDKYTAKDAIDAVCNVPSAQPEQRWIPCSERLPEVNEDGESDYILLSCSNYSLPAIGRYQVDDQGGAFYYGDDDNPLVIYGLFVNAWMPLPEYKENSDANI